MSPSSSIPGPSRSATILVVDDEPTLLESLASLFADEGFTVRTAEDGLEALLLQRQHPADLIISDVNMPLVEGPDLIAELREAGDRTPVVLMSAANLPVCDLPGVRSLAKPFDLEMVLGLVKELVAVTRAGHAPVIPVGLGHIAEPAGAMPLARGLKRSEALRAQADRCYDQLSRARIAAANSRRLLSECRRDGWLNPANGVIHGLSHTA